MQDHGIILQVQVGLVLAVAVVRRAVGSRDRPHPSESETDRKARHW